jgi:hypothetical protein
MGILFNKSKKILQREGLLLFIKRAFLFLKSRIGFSYKIYYIYEKTLNKTNNFEFVPKTTNFTLKTISTSSEIDKLIAEGFNFSSYLNIKNFKEGLSEGAILFCVFIRGDIAHTSWCAMNNTAAIYDPLFQRINYQDTGYIGPCNTNYSYRGLGLYPYVLSQICKFLKKKGKAKALINTSKSNLPSIRGIIKAGFVISGEVRYLKLLLWEFWEEKTTKEVK